MPVAGQGAFQDLVMGSSAGRRMRVGDLQFISGESERTFLIVAVPILERAGLDMTDKSLFCLVDRIGVKGGHASLHHGFIFFLGSRGAFIYHKFGRAPLKVVVVIKHQDAFRIRAQPAETN